MFDIWDCGPFNAISCAEVDYASLVRYSRWSHFTSTLVRNRRRGNVRRRIRRRRPHSRLTSPGDCARSQCETVVVQVEVERRDGLVAEVKGGRDGCLTRQRSRQARSLHVTVFTRRDSSASQRVRRRDFRMATVAAALLQPPPQQPPTISPPQVAVPP